MKLSFKGKIAINSIAILAIMIGCTLLVINEVLHPIVFVLLVPACWPLARNLYREVIIVQSNIERKLKKHLPKIGCTIESIEHGDDDTTRVVGKFKEETFVFDMEKDNPYLTICDPAWLRVSITDSKLPMLMEAVNKTNCQTGATIAFSSPGKDGFRVVHTLYRTILPNVKISDFLGTVLIHILNKKVDFRDNIKEYPWLPKQQKKPMGFTVAKEKDTEQENKSQVAVAAKGNASVDL